MCLRVWYNYFPQVMSLQQTSKMNTIIISILTNEETETHPLCLLNLYAGYIMRNTGLDEAQDGIKTARRNINNLRYADDTTLMAESEEEQRAS